MKIEHVGAFPTKFGEIRVSVATPEPGSLASRHVRINEVYRATVGEVPEGKGSVMVFYPDELRLLLRELLKAAPHVGVNTLDVEKGDDDE